MISTRALIQELNALGRIDVPQASLKRVWLRVLSECTTGMAGVPETNPAQGRACAARPVTPFTPGLRAGTAFPGLAPVLDCARAGSRVWLEVKTYERAVFNRSRCADVHGIHRRHHAHYLQVEAATGSPAWVLILEVETGALLAGKIAELPWFDCQCGGCRAGGRCRVPRGPQVYVDRQELRQIHAFAPAAMLALRRAWREDVAS